MSSIQIQKRDRENTQSLVRRFTKAIRDSGLLHTVRRRRFRARPKSDLAKKLSALRREEIKKQIALREKMGK